MAPQATEPSGGRGGSGLEREARRRVEVQHGVGPVGGGAGGAGAARGARAVLGGGQRPRRPRPLHAATPRLGGYGREVRLCRLHQASPVQPVRLRRLRRRVRLAGGGRGGGAAAGAAAAAAAAAVVAAVVVTVVTVVGLVLARLAGGGRRLVLLVRVVVVAVRGRGRRGGAAVLPVEARGVTAALLARRLHVVVVQFRTGGGDDIRKDGSCVELGGRGRGRGPARPRAGAEVGRRTHFVARRWLVGHVGGVHGHGQRLGLRPRRLDGRRGGREPRHLAAPPGRRRRGDGGGHALGEVVDEAGAPLGLRPAVVAGVDHEQGLGPLAGGRLGGVRELVLDAAVDVQRPRVILGPGRAAGAAADARRGGAALRRRWQGWSHVVRGVARHHSLSHSHSLFTAHAVQK